MLLLNAVVFLSAYCLVGSVWYACVQPCLYVVENDDNYVDNNNNVYIYLDDII